MASILVHDVVALISSELYHRWASGIILAQSDRHVRTNNPDWRNASKISKSLYATLTFSPPERRGFSVSDTPKGRASYATSRDLTSRLTPCPMWAAPISGQANRESPSLSMFFAAFVSAFSVWPQDWQQNTSCEGRLSEDMWPHSEHCWLVYCGGTSTRIPPRQACL
jgi:hypothetical protein